MFVFDFGLGQVAEKLANRHVLAAGGGTAVELLRLGFHALGKVAHLVEIQRQDLPDRLVLHEAAHVLAADQRDVLAEFPPVQFEQAVAVLALLLGHFGEHLGAAGILRPQALGDVGVDAVVLFLVGDGQGEDLAFGKLGEVAHGARMWRLQRGGQAGGGMMRVLRSRTASSVPPQCTGLASPHPPRSPSRSTIASMSAAVAM